MAPMLTRFSAAPDGPWRVTALRPVRGNDLPAPPALRIDAPGTGWTLEGVASNLRYTTADERVGLQARQAPLGRPDARCAALIPIRKSTAWWALAQDERRAIYVRAGHHPIGLEYLPAIARKLYHARDLGGPFDFLTWFEFAAADEPAFDALLARLRATVEWDYVEREVEIRLTR